MWFLACAYVAKFNKIQYIFKRKQKWINAIFDEADENDDDDDDDDDDKHDDNDCACKQQVRKQIQHGIRQCCDAIGHATTSFCIV